MQPCRGSGRGESASNTLEQNAPINDGVGLREARTGRPWWTLPDRSWLRGPRARADLRGRLSSYESFRRRPRHPSLAAVQRA
jgi:hypothetical protein